MKRISCFSLVSIASLLLIGAGSCETDAELKTLDFEEFTIQVPVTWAGTPVQGYDSFVGEIKISDKEKVDFDLGWYSDKLNVDPATHNIDFATIDSKKAKVVKPINFGQGTTGVYFDSLETTKLNRFQISGTGLSSGNQKLFLRAIETLKFKN